jgi:signal transduction histidine kinase
MPKIQEGPLKRLLIQIGIAGGLIAAAFVLRIAITAYAGPGLPTYITFYPALILIALSGGFWIGILATAMVGFSVSYWVLPPEGLAIENLVDIAGLMLFLSMGIFISVVAERYRHIRNRVNEKNLELSRANEALRDLSSRLLTAQEDERKRIASELHDTLGSCLAGVKYRAENGRMQIKEGNVSTSGECFDTMIPLIHECIDECKRIQMDLRPPMLDDVGLSATLSWYFRRFQATYPNIKIEQEIEIDENELASPLRITVFRVTQEGLNNIAKHSHADVVRFQLRKVDRGLELVVQDNGQGFDLKRVISSDQMRHGLGLTSMRERTELSRGSFAIESVVGKGTTIRASWPLP